MGDSGNFIFSRRDDGSLEFKGDFEGLYNTDPDPWGQSGEHPRMKEYYEFSRARLMVTLTDLSDHWGSTLEVGCGAGYVTSLLHCASRREGANNGRFYPRRVVSGLDISATAIIQARERFPGIEFHVGDVTNPKLVPGFDRRYDVVVLSQVLWYVLDRLPIVYANVMALLGPKGHLVIQNAWLDNQEYGRDIMDGFNSLLRYMLDHHAADFQVVSATYDNSNRHAPYHDGLLVLQSTH
jgi:SAM-dependent methyltransferase